MKAGKRCADAVSASSVYVELDTSSQINKCDVTCKPAISPARNTLLARLVSGRHHDQMPAPTCLDNDECALLVVLHGARLISLGAAMNERSREGEDNL